MPDFDTQPEIRTIHGRMVRLLLEHKAEARVADLSDEQIVEQAADIIRTLMAVVVEANDKGDHATLDQLAWFTDACDAEFDEESPPQPRPPQH